MASSSRMSWIAGALALAGAWVGVPLLLGESFTAHMAMHLTVVAIAAPMFAFGIAARPRPLPSRWAWIMAPIPASLLELVVVWGWHAPALHHAAHHFAAVRAAEQLSFLAAGLLLWTSALAGGREGRGAGVLGLLLTSMHMTLLGALLVFAPRALYTAGTADAASALQDQQTGGTLMLLVGGLVYLAGGLYLLAGLLRLGEPARPSPADRGHR